MDVPDAIEKVDNAAKTHGPAVVLSFVLIAVICYFVYSQTQYAHQQDNFWKEVRERDVTKLREDLQEERNFVRGKLIETLEKNTESNNQTSEVIKELTGEIRRQKQ